MKAFGFKKVDFFKSEICAFKYFEEHSEDLARYNVVLFGPQTAHEFMPLYNLKLCWLFKDYRKVVFMQLVRGFSAFGTPTYSILHKEGEEEATEFNSYDELLSHFCQTLETLAVLENIKSSEKKWEKLKLDVEDVIERVPYSVRKIKVLYLGLDATCTEELSNNVTYVQYTDSYNKAELLYSLGKYDIIIAPRMYFKALAHLGVEASEQCIYTGRKLVLLVTYQITDVYSDFGDAKFGENIKLRYTYGMQGLPKLEPQDICFNVLKKTTTAKPFWLGKAS